MPDYKNYNLRQLEDALNSLDKQKYPERIKIIHDEILERETKIHNNPLNEITERMDSSGETKANIILNGNQLEILESVK
ncbi:MAG: hypothetical protein IPH62_00650 [Ignavibacteriae bacterium]|nr:hypothetical protein [Ignavibacteriota bacterium]